MSDLKFNKQPTAIVKSSKIGKGTNIWNFITICEGAEIGENCNICDFCFIENHVLIGNNVTLKCGVYIWDGITIEDNVFVGPNATFTNDLYPRSKSDFKLEKTVLRKGCSIGANATILAGVEVGDYAIVGAGSVVTKSVPNYALVVGNPARIKGWVNSKGEKLINTHSNVWKSESSEEEFIELKGLLHPKNHG